MKVKKRRNRPSIIVVTSLDESKFITDSDREMDFRANEAVEAALRKAKVCKKPIAKYDIMTKTAYLEYPDGRRENVR